MKILKPFLHRSTAKYEDIQFCLDQFYADHLEFQPQAFAFVQGDEQVFTLTWLLKMRHPSRFMWLVPVPGEWHWTWHILKGIFRLWGQYILLPFSQVLNYKSLDLDCNHFHFGEDFLQIITLALIKVMDKLLLLHPTFSPTDVLHYYKRNTGVYELLYMYVYYLCPYWYTRSAIKCGDSKVLTEMWRYWLHLFIATNKYRYARMTVRFLWILNTLEDEVLQQYNKFRTFSFSGDKGTGMGVDGLNELVSNSARFLDVLRDFCLRLIVWVFQVVGALFSSLVSVLKLILCPVTLVYGEHIINLGIFHCNVRNFCMYRAIFVHWARFFLLMMVQYGIHLCCLLSSFQCALLLHCLGLNLFGNLIHCHDVRFLCLLRDFCAQCAIFIRACPTYVVAAKRLQKCLVGADQSHVCYSPFPAVNLQTLVSCAYLFHLVRFLFSFTLLFFLHISVVPAYQILFQLNRMVKHQNKHRISEDRVVLTTEGLNHTMDIHKSMKSLVIKKGETEIKHVIGTSEDVSKMERHIYSKLKGVEWWHSVAKFKSNLWYNDGTALNTNARPSDKAEEAFGKVCDWVTMRTTMLVDPDGQQWVEVPPGEEEPEDEHEDEDESDEDLENDL